MPGSLRRAGHAAQRDHAAAVPFDRRQAVRLGPAAIAVHDDRDVARHGGASADAPIAVGQRAGVMPAGTIRSRRSASAESSSFISHAQNAQRAATDPRTERGKHAKRKRRPRQHAPRLHLGHERRCPRSHFHDLFFFCRDERVDLFDVTCRSASAAISCMRLLSSSVISCVLLLGLELVVRFVAHVANRDLAVFGLLLDDFGQIFATLFVERRNDKPDRAAVDVGREAEVALLDRLADIADTTPLSNAVITQRTRVGRRDAGHLFERTGWP